MDKEPAQFGEPVYEVVWPSGTSITKPLALAGAITDLNGKTVCELWDWMFRGDEMYALINQELRIRYPGIRFVDHKTMGNIDGADQKGYIDKLPDLLRAHGCDALISAVGA